MNNLQWNSYDNQEHVDVALKANGLHTFEWEKNRVEFMNREGEEYGRMMGERQLRKRDRQKIDQRKVVEKKDVEDDSENELEVGKKKSRKGRWENVDDFERELTRLSAMSNIVRDQERERKRVAVMSKTQREHECERHRVERLTDAQQERARERHRVQQLTDAQQERARERHRVEQLTDAQQERARERHRVEQLTDAQQERARERHRVEQMSAVQIQRQQLRHHMGEMSFDANESHRERNRISGMTSERLDHEHDRFRVANMTLVQIEYRERKQDREYQRKRLEDNLESRRVAALNERETLVLARANKLTPKSLILTWSITCEHCQCVYLNSMEDKQKRKSCCDHGKLMVNDMRQYAFDPMDESMYELLIANFKHLQTSSLYYNSILSLGATAVDTKNDPVDPQKWVHCHGPHGVKVHGRTTHFLPHADSSKTTNGIEFFTFHSINAPSLEHVPDAVREQVNPDLLNEFADRLKVQNKWVHIHQNWTFFMI